MTLASVSHSGGRTSDLYVQPVALRRQSDHPSRLLSGRNCGRRPPVTGLPAKLLVTELGNISAGAVGHYLPLSERENLPFERLHYWGNVTDELRPQFGQNGHPSHPRAGRFRMTGVGKTEQAQTTHQRHPVGTHPPGSTASRPCPRRRPACWPARLA